MVVVEVVVVVVVLVVSGYRNFVPSKLSAGAHML